MPRRFPKADGYGRVPYIVRRAILDNHLILFTIDEVNATVYVVGLRDGRRLPRPGDVPIAPRDNDAQ